jgi:hypothetical protein
MEPEGLLPCSQQPTTGPYPESDENPVHTYTSYLPYIHSNIILPSASRFSEWSPHFSRDSSVSIVSILRAGRPGFDSRQMQSASRHVLVPIQFPIQWAPGVKRIRHERDHSPASFVEVTNVWTYSSTPPYAFTGC